MTVFARVIIIVTVTQLKYRKRGAAKVNVLELKAECVRHNYTIESLAKAIEINKVTMYRKLNGESSFTREEMQAIRNKLSLNDEMFLKIFFS